jgi:hypothetical protein
VQETLSGMMTQPENSIVRCGETPFSPAFQWLLPNHVHEFDADQGALSCLKRLESQHGASDPCDVAVVLFNMIT